MADIALEQLLHTVGDNTLGTTDGALHSYMRGTDGTTTRTVKTDADGNIIISPGLGTEATLAAVKAVLDSLDGKDYATQATLAEVLAKLADPATATKQDAAKVVLDAISTAVAARATEATLAQIKTALTDGTLKAQLSGRKAQLRVINADANITVAAGASENVDITPTAGCMARIIALQINANSPTGATKGSHMLQLFLGTSVPVSIINAYMVYNKTGGISTMAPYGAADTSMTPPNFTDVLGMIRFSSALPLRVAYRNDTDVAQTKLRVIRLVIEEEPIAWT